MSAAPDVVAEDRYLVVARIAWTAGFVFILILLTIVASASTATVDGSLRGGILALVSLLLVCNVVVAGRVMMRAAPPPLGSDGGVGSDPARAT